MTRDLGTGLKREKEVGSKVGSGSSGWEDGERRTPQSDLKEARREALSGGSGLHGAGEKEPIQADREAAVWYVQTVLEKWDLRSSGSGVAQKESS